MVIAAKGIIIAVQRTSERNRNTRLHLAGAVSGQAWPIRGPASHRYALHATTSLIRQRACRQTLRRHFVVGRSAPRIASTQPSLSRFRAPASWNHLRASFVKGDRGQPPRQVPVTSTCVTSSSPRRISDADAFEQPAASAISESFTLVSPGRISRQNCSGSWTVPGLALSPLHSARCGNECRDRDPRPKLWRGCSPRQLGRRRHSSELTHTHTRILFSSVTLVTPQKQL